ncbi:MAG: efflux RND transporter periplasmic adaptor subunit [Negativicutes bacterium]|jgi:RND family efflux transporter MFP subunit
MQNKRAIIAGTIALVVVVAAIAGIAANLLNTERLNRLLKDNTAVVRVAPVFEMKDYLTFNIYTDSRIRVEPAVGSAATVYAQLDGRIISIKKTAGDAVTDGETLAAYDNQDLIAQRLQAEAKVAVADAQLIQAERELNQQRDLLAGDATPREKYDKAREMVTIAKENLRIETATAGIAERNLGKQTVVATMNGIIMHCYVTSGSMVGRGAQLFEIADPNNIELKFLTNKSFAQNLKAGMELRIEANNGMNGKYIFNGVLAEKYKEAHAQGEYESVKIRLKNIAGFLVKSGDNGNEGGSGYTALKNLSRAFSGGFTLFLPYQQSAKVVPRYAIMYKNGEPFVYIVDDHNIACQRFIKLGGNFGDDYVEVTGGLKLGERVITVGHESIYPGMKVIVVNAAK